MFGSWCTLPLDAMMLAFESQAVIGLRLARLATGGAAAATEAECMVSEKIFAAGEAAMTMAMGGSAATVISDYRSRVRANHRRLSRR